MEHNATMGGMMMYLYASAESTILFKGWETFTWLELFGSCIAVFVMAVLTEGLTPLRENIDRRYSYQQHADETTNLKPADMCIEENTVAKRPGYFSKRHTLQTLLHVLQTFLRFILMLVVMTFNVWLLLAVTFGFGLGYFIFRRPRH